jgi:hypothetical protein
MLAVVIAISLAAFAIGKGAGSATNVVLCANKQGGDLALASHGKCEKGSKSLKIAKRGPTGPAGSAGAQGPAGQDGQNGKDGSDASVQPEPPHVVGATTTACATQLGSFCDVGGCGRWTSPDPPALSLTYSKDAEGFVHLEGGVQAFNGGGACADTRRNMFYLPPGYRPAGTLHFESTYCDGSTTALVTVDSAGLVQGPRTVVPCMDLSGETFRAAG